MRKYIIMEAKKWNGCYRYGSMLRKRSVRIVNTNEFDSLDRKLLRFNVPHNMRYGQSALVPKSGDLFYILEIPEQLEIRLLDLDDVENEGIIVQNCITKQYLCKHASCDEALMKVLDFLYSHKGVKE